MGKDPIVQYLTNLSKRMKNPLIRRSIDNEFEEKNLTDKKQEILKLHIFLRDNEKNKYLKSNKIKEIITSIESDYEYDPYIPPPGIKDINNYSSIIEKLDILINAIENNKPAQNNERNIIKLNSLERNLNNRIKK